MRWQNPLIVAMVSALGVISTSAHADAISRIKETQTLTIAHRESSHPFSYLGEDKKPQGYSIDICNRLAESIKRELKLTKLNINYVMVNPSTRIAAISQHKADIECGSTTNNAERRAQVAFTIPHFFTSTRMLVRSDSGVKNWPDLKDKKVVTTVNTTALKLLEDRNKVRALGVKVTTANDHEQSFSMLESFNVDAFAMDDVLLFGLRANSKDPAKFAVVGDALATDALAMMVAKEDVAFKTLLDKEIAKMMIDGEITRLYDKWFRKPIPPKGANLNMPMNLLLRETIRFPTDKVAD